MAENDPRPEIGDGDPDDGVIEGEVIPFPDRIGAQVATAERGQKGGEWRPIVPEHLRTRAGIKKAAHWHYRRARHHTLYHLVRIPARVPITVWWAGVGAVRIVFAQTAWWWLAEQTYLRHKAIADGDAGKYLMLHKHAREVRLGRGIMLLAEAIAVTGAGAAITLLCPLAWIPVGLAGVLLLAQVGRPDHRPIVTSATVPVAVDRLTVEVIVRALGALGIGEMNKALAKGDDRAIVTLDGPMRDGAGWLWRGDLPHGVTAAMVAEKREELASGLRRPAGCVWPETAHRRHPGALDLYVCDEDMTTMEQPPWALAKKGRVDMFEGTVFAYDPRGRAVTVCLMFASVIIGSIPRMGKTFLLRLLLLICALDPRCEIHAFDLKGTGDLAPLRPVAHAYRAGAEDDDIAYLAADMQKLAREVNRRAKIIRDIAEQDPARCPENKVTPELASDPRLNLHPVAIALDECQKAFEHPEFGKFIQAICEDLVRRGPALGMIILLATQRPDKDSIPTQISANAVLRFCLKVMGQVDTDLVMGTSSYKSGTRPNMFSFDDKGVCYFGGEGAKPRIVRSQNINGPMARLVVARAFEMRRAEGRITGYAAGMDIETETRDFAADVLLVFGNDTNLWCETIADRLRESLGGAYAAITRDAVSSMLRDIGVEVKSVRETGKGPRAGCAKAAIRPERA